MFVIFQRRRRSHRKSKPSAFKNYTRRSIEDYLLAVVGTIHTFDDRFRARRVRFDSNGSNGRFFEVRFFLNISRIHNFVAIKLISGYNFNLNVDFLAIVNHGQMEDKITRIKI